MTSAGAENLEPAGGMRGTCACLCVHEYVPCTSRKCDWDQGSEVLEEVLGVWIET